VVHHTGRNVGETDESVLIATLISLKGKCVNSLGVTICSVASYNGKEYSSEAKQANISKAPIEAKRDVLINGEGYSLKSCRASPPAIVNHTTREKWVRVCEILNVKMDGLDEMVSEYWNLRTSGRIGEDIPTSDSRCPFGNTDERQRYLKILIDYFLFDGTGSGKSSFPARYILQFVDPADPSGWNVLNREKAFWMLWPKMVFSIRSKKGMPSNYPSIDLAKKSLMEPWVRNIDGDYRGALHIRARK
jgi:hypothetical protein